MVEIYLRINGYMFDGRALLQNLRFAKPLQNIKPVISSFAKGL